MEHELYDVTIDPSQSEPFSAFDLYATVNDGAQINLVSGKDLQFTLQVINGELTAHDAYTDENTVIDLSPESIEEFILDRYPQANFEECFTNSQITNKINELLEDEEDENEEDALEKEDGENEVEDVELNDTPEVDSDTDEEPEDEAEPVVGPQEIPDVEPKKEIDIVKPHQAMMNALLNGQQSKEQIATLGKNLEAKFRTPAVNKLIKEADLAYPDYTKLTRLVGSLSTFTDAETFFKCMHSIIKIMDKYDINVNFADIKSTKLI